MMPGGDKTGRSDPGTRKGSRPCRAMAAGYRAGFGHGHGHQNLACQAGLPGWMRVGAPSVDSMADPAAEKAMLEDQVRFLENQLDLVKEQLSRMEE